MISTEPAHALDGVPPPVMRIRQAEFLKASATGFETRRYWPTPGVRAERHWKRLLFEHLDRFRPYQNMLGRARNWRMYEQVRQIAQKSEQRHEEEAIFQAFMKACPRFADEEVEWSLAECDPPE